jgi:hypothetical protein
MYVVLLMPERTHYSRRTDPFDCGRFLLGGTRIIHSDAELPETDAFDTGSVLFCAMR